MVQSALRYKLLVVVVCSCRYVVFFLWFVWSGRHHCEFPARDRLDNSAGQIRTRAGVNLKRQIEAPQLERNKAISMGSRVP